MSFKIKQFKPGRHAGPAHQFGQSHVVVGEVPLDQIEFDPRHDELAEFVGHRVPASCPQFDELAADTATPPIQGAEQRQHLTISCNALAYLKAGVTAYSTCLDKVKDHNLEIEQIPAEWLGDNDRYRQFYCPFAYLGGLVTHGKATVEIAVTATNPFGEISYEAT